MIGYGQFCLVAKTAEILGDRWTPIIMRELCFAARVFGELLVAAPLISRTVLAQRLKELAQAGVIHIESKAKGKGHLYRLTPAGEGFRSIVELISIWRQRWGHGLAGSNAGLCRTCGRSRNGEISLHGSTRALAKARRLLALPDEPTLKSFRFSAFPSPSAVAAE